MPGKLTDKVAAVVGAIFLLGIFVVIFAALAKIFLGL